MGVDPVVEEDDVVLLDDVLAPGYGQLNDATRLAMAAAARSEGLILDPIYSGKAMAGFLQRAGQAEAGQTLLFLHTGGTPAVFAYGAAMSALD